MKRVLWWLEVAQKTEISVKTAEGKAADGKRATNLTFITRTAWRDHRRWREIRGQQFLFGFCFREPPAASPAPKKREIEIHFMSGNSTMFWLLVRMFLIYLRYLGACVWLLRGKLNKLRLLLHTTPPSRELCHFTPQNDLSAVQWSSWLLPFSYFFYFGGPNEARLLSYDRTICRRYLRYLADHPG